MKPNKLHVENISEDYTVITCVANGKVWEITIKADFEEDGGLSVNIARDSELCVETGFSWDEKHQNEPQED